MKLTTLILPALIALSPHAYAQEKIFKCVSPDGVVYRDTPCETQQEQVQVTTARKVNWRTDEASAGQAPESRLAAMPLSSSRLYIGMTDTQVLNLSSWGRPSQIIRSKAGRTWREQWVYKDRSTGDERRFLYFENARLVEQEDAPSPSLIQARATLE